MWILILTAAAILGAVGLLMALGLMVAARRFAVDEDPRIDQINEMLPGANCGACGVAGCRAFAEALVRTRDPEMRCPACTSQTMGQIGELLGLALGPSAPAVARLLCQGREASVKTDSLYEGIEDCRASLLVYRGMKQCSFGCLGMGSCMRACPFDAIRLKDGIIEIDEAKCTACGKCVQACPRSLITLCPKGELVYVACSSPERGNIVRRQCSAGCIGCMRCKKKCPYGAITIEDNLARIDQAKCTQCGECVGVCPTKVILHLHQGENPRLEALPEKSSGERVEEAQENKGVEP